MKHSNFFSLVFLIAAPFISTAQYWQKLDGPYGGAGVVQTGKQGFLFLAIGQSELYRSSDNGLHWHLMTPTPSSSLSRQVVVCPDGNLYASSGSTIFRSMDNGGSWNPIGSVLLHQSICALPNGTILAGSPLGMQRSLNDGQIWTTVSSDVKSTDGFSYNPHNGDVYAWKKLLSTGSLGTIWRSADGGETWSVMLEALNLSPYQFAYSPNGSIFIGAREVIWRSLDSAATWVSLGPVVPNGEKKVSVAVSATGRLFASEWYNSKYSDDNGNTWHLLQDSGRNGLFDLSTTPSGQVFGVRLEGGLQRSDDNGLSWNFSSMGAKRTTVNHLCHINETDLLARTGDGLFYSKDSGSSWSLIWDKVRTDIFPGPSVQVTPGGDWYLWDGFDIVKFSDEGQTHTKIPRPPGTEISPFSGFWVSPASGKVFIHLQQGLFASSDDGQSWGQLFQAASFFQGLLFMPDGSMLCFLWNGVHKSTDDGLTFVKISDLRFNEVPFLAANGSVYGLKSTGPKTFCASHDGGLTWENTLITHNYSIFSPLVNHAGLVLAYDNLRDKVLRSVDGGHSYNPLPAINNGNGHIDGISMNPAQHLFCLLRNDGLYRSIAPTTQVKLLTGSTYHDLDGACTLSVADSILTGRIVRATQNGQHVYGISDPLGKYIVPVPAGNWQISMVPPNHYWGNCAASVSVPSNNDIGVVDSAHVGLRVLTPCPYVEVDVSSPFLRRCFESQIYVHYRNSGTVPATDARMEITLDSMLEFNNASIPLSAQNGQTLIFQLSDVPVNANGKFTLTATPSCNAELGYIHCVKAHFFPDELCPPVTGARVRTSAACLGDSIQLRIENIGTADMEDTKNWRVFNFYNPNLPFGMVDHGEFQLGAGEVFTKNIASGYQRLSFVAAQSAHYPFNSASKTDIFGCGTSPGEFALNIVTDDDEGPFTDQFCVRNIGAYDPNDKQGFPVGLSEQGYIERDQTLEYLIRFQNTGTDTAFNVSILDTLPEWLDPATLRLGATSHPCTMKLLPFGTLMLVFEGILLPDSNINEPASHGFAQFKIAQKAANPIGSTIRNRAGIYFDFNPPVITNQTLHTVGIPLTTGSEMPSSTSPALSISPNPFREATLLTLSDDAFQDHGYRFELFDLAGKQVRSVRFNGPNMRLERAQLPSGAYPFVLKNLAGKIIGNGTLIAH